MKGEVIVASRKRLLFALYLDLILFLALWGLINYLITDGELHLGAGVLAFGVVKFATRKLFGSPGMRMLGIGQDRVVEAQIYNRENWLTMFLGGLFVLEGTKELVYWTQLFVPEPFFGFMPSGSAQVLIHLSAGILFVSIGYLYLRLMRPAFWLAVLAMSGAIVSCVLSWSLWVQIVPELVVARRAVQAQTVRAGEVEFMQTIMPMGFVVLDVVILVAVLCTFRRVFSPSLLESAHSGHQ